MALGLLLGWERGLETAWEARLAGRDWPKLTEVGALSAEDNNNTRATCECFRDSSK